MMTSLSFSASAVWGTYTNMRYSYLFHITQLQLKWHICYFPYIIQNVSLIWETWDQCYHPLCLRFQCCGLSILLWFKVTFILWYKMLLICHSVTWGGGVSHLLLRTSSPQVKGFFSQAMWWKLPSLNCWPLLSLSIADQYKSTEKWKLSSELMKWVWFNISTCSVSQVQEALLHVLSSYLLLSWTHP